MLEFLSKLFTSDFMPHGHCFLWSPSIIWLHVGSDVLIILSYYSIPLALIYLLKKRFMPRRGVTFRPWEEPSPI